MNCSPTIYAVSEEIQVQRETPFICFGWESKEGFWSIHCKTRKSELKQTNNKQGTTRTVDIFIKGKELIAVVAYVIARASFGVFLLFGFF